MPFLVQDYTWTQSDKIINIRVPVKKVNHEKVDIFTTDIYIKANFSPFLFEVFLLHEIDNEKSRCVVEEDLITFDLVKTEEGHWKCLEKDLTKAEKMKLKFDIHEKSQADAKQKAEENKSKQSKLDRFTVQQSMEIDTKQHALMDSRKNAERNKAMDALEEWRTNLNNTNTVQPRMLAQNNPKSSVRIVELPSSDDADTKKEIKSSLKNVSKRSQPKKPVKSPVRSEYIEKKKEEVAKRVLPKLREMGEVEVTHTARNLPTPSRESVAEEERTWLENITLARRATGFVSEDLRPEEQDPQWCKNKGDEFFRAGNFLGAISAYSHGIRLSDKLPTLYANRAATHFALGNFNKCLGDCSAALDLMKPECESNRRSRAKCIARRAAALARVGYLNKAIDEMKAAAKLMPNDEAIKKDVFDMERAWEQNPDSD